MIFKDWLDEKHLKNSFVNKHTKNNETDHAKQYDDWFNTNSEKTLISKYVGINEKDEYWTDNEWWIHEKDHTKQYDDWFNTNSEKTLDKIDQKEEFEKKLMKIQGRNGLICGGVLGALELLTLAFYSGLFDPIINFTTTIFNGFGQCNDKSNPQPTAGQTVQEQLSERIDSTSGIDQHYSFDSNNSILSSEIDTNAGNNNESFSGIDQHYSFDSNNSILSSEIDANAGGNNESFIQDDAIINLNDDMDVNPNNNNESFISNDAIINLNDDTIVNTGSNNGGANNGLFGGFFENEYDFDD